MKDKIFKFITGRFSSVRNGTDFIPMNTVQALSAEKKSKQFFIRSTKWNISLVIIFHLLFNTELIAQNEKLDTYLTQASENNPKLKSLFEQYLASLEKLPQAKSLPDPTIMFNLFASPVETRVGAQRAGISISQAFPWFGQLKDQEALMAMRSKAKYELFKNEKNRIHFEVKAVYYDLYVIEAALSITKQNLNLLESLKELANVKLESGQGSAVDILRVEMQIAELNSQYEYLVDSREPLRTEFWSLLNVDKRMLIDLPQTLQALNIAESKSKLIETMLSENPELKKYDFDYSSLSGEIDVAKSMGKPSFILGMAYTNISERSDVNIPDNGKDALVFPQIGLKIPLYRKKYDALIKEKTYMRVANTFEKKQNENVLTIAMERAWKDYRNADRRIKLKEKLTVLAKQSLEILVTEYTNASKDFEEILRMEKSLLTYKLELEEAKADMNTSAAYIMYLIGKEN